MLHYDRTDESEGIDLTKSKKSRECMICNYCFFNDGFKFQDHVCNGCHDLTMLFLNISNIDFESIQDIFKKFFFLSYIKWLIV